MFNGLGLLVSAATLHFALYPRGVRARPSFLLFMRLSWAAMLLDAVAAALSRHFDVKRHAPGFDGELLDSIVDYQLFALLPALGIVVFERLIPLEMRYMLAVTVLVTAGYTYCRRGPTRGLPPYWNVALFYVRMLRMPAYAVVAVYAMCALLSFVPIRFERPSSNVWLAAGSAWAACMLLPVIAPRSPHALNAVRLSLGVVVSYLAAAIARGRVNQAL